MQYQKTINGIGPHTAHLLFKIVLILLAVLIYTIVNLYGLGFLLKFSLSLYLAVPICIRFSPWILKNLIYLNNLWWPAHHKQYFEPKFHQIDNGRNFYLNPSTCEENATAGIGVWHILPASLNNLKEEPNFWTNSLCKSGKPIVMYFHGNMGSRATLHRIDIYKMLTELLDCHVLAFDYCGFADSCQVIIPSESSLFEDSLVVYKWLSGQIANADAENRPKIFIWGHSLGTSISSNLISKLQNPKIRLQNGISNALNISGLILEAPFTNMAEEFQSFPLNQIYSWLPMFDWFFIQPLYNIDAAFETDIYLQELNEVPILIIHGTNDIVVPCTLGEKLYKRIKFFRSSKLAAINNSGQGGEGRTGANTTRIVPIHYKQLDGLNSNLAHTFLYTLQQFPQIVKEFCK